MYMDNVVTGTICDDKALEYYSLSRSYLQEAGVNLRQWTSNSTALNRRAQENNAYAAQTTQILELTWNSTNDMPSLSLEKMIRKSEAITKLTKRSTISFADQWLNQISDISNLTSIEIPRPYFLTSISKRQLHIFCDSSQLAYGAVAYLRGMSGAEIYTAFTMAKTRVAPIKTQTVLQRRSSLCSRPRKSNFM